MERTLEDADTKSVRLLTSDDKFLLRTVIQYRELCVESITAMLGAIDVLHQAYTFLNPQSDILKSALYVQAVAGRLEDSSFVGEILLSIRKMSSDRLGSLLELSIASCGDPELSDALSPLKTELNTLISSDEIPLRSEHDLRHETLRTTVVAQKVEMSRQKSALSEKDSAYSALLKRVHDIFGDYFEEYLMNPQDLFMSEIYFYDLKSPHRDVLMPRPRHAIERALGHPHDYLGCNCCGTSLEGLSSTQPATAILYQLYLESGALINVFDLWSAFYAIVGGEGGEDCDEANAL